MRKHSSSWSEQTEHSGGEDMSSSMHKHHNAQQQASEQVFVTHFTALNNSGVSGGAAIVLDRATQTVTIEIDATGLTPGETHVQHIHGFTNDTNAETPTLAQDADHDGFVELAEGLGTYGQILLNLTTNPDNATHDHGTAGHDHTDLDTFPTADAQGNLHYVETFHFDANDPNAQAVYDSIMNLGQKEIVLHGESVAEGSGTGTMGEVDGTGGFKAVLPVASGELHAVTGHEAKTVLKDLAHDRIASDDSLADHLLGQHHEARSGHQDVFVTRFTALNNSGVEAGAAVILDKDSHTITVEIDATGLEPNETHVQHIHGFTDDTKAESPTLAQDADHDGFVELAEGLATYGQILLNLTTNPDNATHDHGTAGHDHTNLDTFPKADAEGNLHYVETFNFDENDPNAMAIYDSIMNLGQKEIVLHGESVAAGSGMGTMGEVDGTGGYKAVLPVASGELQAVYGHDAKTVLQNFAHDQIAADHSLSDFLLGHVA